MTNKPDDFLDTIPDETVLEMQGVVRDWLEEYAGVISGELYEAREIRPRNENDLLRVRGKFEDATLLSARASRVYSELERLQAKLDAWRERAVEIRTMRLVANIPSQVKQAEEAEAALVLQLALDTVTDKDGDAK